MKIKKQDLYLLSSTTYYLIMNKKDYKAEPGDGLRSLKSTMLFRAVNYELYVRPVRLLYKLKII